MTWQSQSVMAALQQVNTHECFTFDTPWWRHITYDVFVSCTSVELVSLFFLCPLVHFLSAVCSFFVCDRLSTGSIRCVLSSVPVFLVCFTRSLDSASCFWSFLLLATFHDSVLIRIYWSHSGFVDLWVKSVSSFLNASLLDIIPAFEQKKYLIDTLGVIWQDLEYLFKFICYLMSNLKQECTSNQTHMKMSPNYCNILCISRWTKEGMKKFSWSCFGRLDFENKDEKSAT